MHDFRAETRIYNQRLEFLNPQKIRGLYHHYYFLPGRANWHTPGTIFNFMGLWDTGTYKPVVSFSSAKRLAAKINFIKNSL